MQLDRLLIDASDLPPGTSKRQQCLRLAELLNANAEDGSTTALKTVEQWFFRSSVPAPRLMQIVRMAEKVGRPINLSDYA